MRSMKRRLAIFLAVLLIIPVMPVSAEEMPVPTPVLTEDIEKEDMKHDLNAPVEEGNNRRRRKGKRHWIQCQRIQKYPQSRERLWILRKKRRMQRQLLLLKHQVRLYRQLLRR